MNPHVRLLVVCSVGRSVIISLKKTGKLHFNRSYRSTCFFIKLGLVHFNNFHISELCTYNIMYIYVYIISNRWLIKLVCVWIRRVSEPVIYDTPELDVDKRQRTSDWVSSQTDLRVLQPDNGRAARVGSRTTFQGSVYMISNKLYRYRIESN